MTDTCGKCGHPITAHQTAVDRRPGPCSVCGCGVIFGSARVEAMSCDARTRPFIPMDDTEIACEETGDHAMHRGTLRDYAYPGSATVVSWEEDDRRTFHGEWPGLCPENCTLPIGHRGNHAP